MKIQLDENTLNTYINEAIRQELMENNTDELLGSRHRKNNIRMITGQGWGNQNRDTKNFWGAANTDISATDAESEAPQTLVGIVTKMEKQLMDLEKVVGIAPQAENLGASITQTRNNGGVKVKASLLAAINALGRISDRLSVVEKQTGMNTLMESVDEKIFNVGYTAQKPTWINGALGAVKGTLGATIGGGIAVVAGIAAICFGIAQTATTLAAKGRTRNIVRTYNCASILAKRMGNVAEAYKEKLEALKGAQTQQNPEMQQETGQVNELNVGRAKKSFGSIEQGMQQLSQMMKEIYAKVNGQDENAVQIPQSLNTPQEIKQFQEWANANGYVDQNGQQLVPDGKFGRRTSYVYDQVAQKLNQLQESSGPINEAGGIEHALKTLERKVGTTGTGGAAYTDISAMSGGEGATRLQNAQAAKAIMRTYPPVLNQYLQILKSAGANVNNLLPLRDDQRPHRNYSVSELQTIDKRIKELTQVAQTFQPQQQSGNVTLPPKPQVRQTVQNSPQPVEPEEPELPRDTGEPLPQIDNSALLNNPGAVAKSTRDVGDMLQRPETNLSPSQSAAQTMAQLAGSDLPDRRARIRDTASNALHSGAAISRSQQQAIRDARRSAIQATRQPHEPLSEQAFKKLVKQVIKETLN